MALSEEQLQTLGISSQHIVFDVLPPGVDQPVHRALIEPFMALKKKAALAGIDLCIASGFRSFERQLKIWNDKATGMRAVLDVNEKPVDIHALSDREKLFHILRWSALPGASRHHWGSEIDVYDRAVIDDTYRVQLTNHETTQGGVFAHLHGWLDDLFAKKQAEGFERPYVEDRGGVSPERWHLSYRPIASEYASLLTKPLLVAQLQKTEIELQAAILENLDEVFDRYVRC
ncbi:MAG: M15 family metallopeptidase [Pseudomonadales bacterium]|nr:M15 family metallopeptidase [Pseudomonadales bacterium]